MLNPIPFWPAPRPSLHVFQWALQPFPADLIAPALTFTTGSYSLTRESLELPYQVHNQPWVLSVMKGDSVQPGVAQPQSQFSLMDIAAFPNYVAHTLSWLSCVPVDAKPG